VPDDRPAGFYRWRLRRQATPVEMEVRDALQKVGLEWPPYGYRRITRELQRRGFEINHKHVLRMMREDNLLCMRRRTFVVTTDSRHNRPDGILGYGQDNRFNVDSISEACSSITIRGSTVS
jgi:transposase InsO family protein